MPNLLVFAGTTEGRTLLEALSGSIDGSGLTVYACVATDYGKDLLPEGLEHIQVKSGRLTEDEMSALMEEKRFDYVIDTTHPYARLASENIKAACKRTGCEYIRVLRSSGIKKQMDCMFFSNHEEVVDYLNQTEGNVLLTIGSKELSKYTRVREFQNRIFPRVLPMLEVVESCFVLGFSGKQLICMQGPFTAELNVALIKQINARYIVTKDSGETGGFLEKYQAAQQTGAVMMVIGREKEEQGISLEAILELLEKTYRIVLQPSAEVDKGQWFPLFSNLSGKTVVVIGAGKIGKRRIESLLKFDCHIRVIARDADQEIVAYAARNKLELRIKSFDSEDLQGADYALAATNEKQINHKIYEKCKENGIPVNVADDKEKSDFYFPGIIRAQGITVGVTAEGKDHALAKKATRAIADSLDKISREHSHITCREQEGGKIGTEKN